MAHGKATSLAGALSLCILLFGIVPTGNAKDRTEALRPVPLPDITTVDWALQVPADVPVALSGVVSFDAAGTGQGAMMYPAPNAAGLLAAIVTHGVLESSMKRKQREKLQEAADQVLLPYQSVLANYSNNNVALEALLRQPFGYRKTLAAVPSTPATSWRIDSAPRFSLTQDQRAFILDNAITVYAPASNVPAYRTAVHVVSHPRDGEDLVGLWTANQGTELKKEWGYLFAESVDVALRVLSAKPGNDVAAFETVRYAEGSSEKMERAQPLYKECGRVVLKTLRGALMSVPVRAKADRSTDDASCPEPVEGIPLESAGAVNT